MAVARIQFVLHVGGVIALGEQLTCTIFDVGKIERAARVFECLIMREQRFAADQGVAIEAQHTLFGKLHLGLI